jgi:hypothetical protein
MWSLPGYEALVVECMMREMREMRTHPEVSGSPQTKGKVTMGISLVERELGLQITIVGMGSLDKSESESDESESECVDDGEIEWEKG